MKTIRAFHNIIKQYFLTWIKKGSAFVVSFICGATSAFANPEGGTVTAGSATINSPTANTVVVNQTTDKAIINWQSFNIQSPLTSICAPFSILIFLPAT